ncbi:hypothetical protein [Aquabacterium sp. J223]|nr:hypothetical protein [Aquabacterium sp. J223]UUX95824.1 hypothetical protein LRS07_00230 [Aquabacterium sp. J223]
MWKILIGFVLFAAVVMYFLSQGGDIDMTGEKHGRAGGIPSPAAAEVLRA